MSGSGGDNSNDTTPQQQHNQQNCLNLTPISRLFPSIRFNNQTTVNAQSNQQIQRQMQLTPNVTQPQQPQQPVFGRQSIPVNTLRHQQPLMTHYIPIVNNNIGSSVDQQQQQQQNMINLYNTLQQQNVVQVMDQQTQQQSSFNHPTISNPTNQFQTYPPTGMGQPVVQHHQHNQNTMYGRDHVHNAVDDEGDGIPDGGEQCPFFILRKFYVDVNKSSEFVRIKNITEEAKKQMIEMRRLLRYKNRDVKKNQKKCMIFGCEREVGEKSGTIFIVTGVEFEVKKSDLAKNYFYVCRHHSEKFGHDGRKRRREAKGNL